MESVLFLLLLRPNYRALRLAAYTWGIHGHLGRYQRRVIPTCVLSAIRKAFSEKDPPVYRDFEEAKNPEDFELPYWPG